MFYTYLLGGEGVAVAGSIPSSCEVLSFAVWLFLNVAKE